MTQGHLGAADLLGKAIECPTAQARTETAVGFTLRDFTSDNAVGVFVEDMLFDIELIQILGQYMLREARLFLIQIHRHQLKLDWRAGLQTHQNI